MMTVELPPCKIRVLGDLTGCIAPGCGLRWDTNDPQPPVCPRRSVAQRLNRREVGEAQRRLAALYSEPAWPLSRILRIALLIGLPLAIGIAVWLY